MPYLSHNKMSSKPERPGYEVKVAETRDELEACFDIRVEGTYAPHSETFSNG